MFDRISRSFQLARASWNVLYTDKKLVLFPVISGVLALLVFLSFAGSLLGLHFGGVVNLDPQQNNGTPPWMYAVLFVYYFCSYFVILFCNSALISCALMRFNGDEPTLGDGFRAAAARLPQIAAWSLVSATVGVLLRLIENSYEKAGEIISAILGTAWTVLTFFVVPVLVVEKTGPFTAISRSVALLRKAWGEALVGGFGLGLFKFLLLIVPILVMVGGVALLVAVQPAGIGLAVLALGILLLLLAVAMGAALDTIFLAALYQYAAFEKVPNGFSRDDLAGAFQSKK
jgi:hypothetical protein